MSGEQFGRLIGAALVAALAYGVVTHLGATLAIAACAFPLTLMARAAVRLMRGAANAQY